MNDELVKRLKEFAREKANEPEDIDIDILMGLIIDGAEWMYNNDKKRMELEIELQCTKDLYEKMDHEVEIELHQDYLLARTIQIERELKKYA